MVISRGVKSTCFNNNLIAIKIFNVKKPPPINRSFWAELVKEENSLSSENRAKKRYKLITIRIQLIKTPIPFLLKISCETTSIKRTKAIGLSNVAVEIQ